MAIYEQLAEDNFAAYGPDLADSLNDLSLRLGESVESAAEQAKQFMEIRAQLQLIKCRVRDENIQVPAHLARLFESNQADEDD